MVGLQSYGKLWEKILGVEVAYILLSVSCFYTRSGKNVAEIGTKYCSGAVCNTR